MVIADVARSKFLVALGLRSQNRVWNSRGSSTFANFRVERVENR